MQEIVENICHNFFTKLWTDFSNLQIEKQGDEIFKISLKSEDSHLLIGPHGKNLDTLTHLLKLIISKQSHSYINIHLEINDYLEQKDQKLMNFIASKISLVKDSWKEVILPFFTAYERKKVHSYVSEHWGNIITQSIWEGKDRRIHLTKKEEKMTIDIDGDDI